MAETFEEPFSSFRLNHRHISQILDGFPGVLFVPKYCAHTFLMIDLILRLILFHKESVSEQDLVFKDGSTHAVKLFIMRVLRLGSPAEEGFSGFEVRGTGT